MAEFHIGICMKGGDGSVKINIANGVNLFKPIQTFYYTKFEEKN
jgi:hypothetical protein